MNGWPVAIVSVLFVAYRLSRGSVKAQDLIPPPPVPSPEAVRYAAAAAERLRAEVEAERALRDERRRERLARVSEGAAERRAVARGEWGAESEAIQ